MLLAAHLDEHGFISDPMVLATGPWVFPKRESAVYSSAFTQNLLKTGKVNEIRR